MRAFRVWIRDLGFVAEGVEWGTDGPILAHSLDSDSPGYWSFTHMNKARDYILAAYGPDAHVIFASAGELRFEVPGLLPARPASPGEPVLPPDLLIPETPDAPRSTRKTRRIV